MSINVYLKDEEVRKLKGFKETKTGGSIPGVTLLYKKGRWFTVLHQLTEPVPPAVVNIVDEISFHSKIPFHIEREAGIYRDKTAEAEIDLNESGNEEWNVIRINAKNMEDILKLFRMILIGSIRPEPGESYQGKQKGVSRKELEEELEGYRQSEDALRYFFGELRGEKNPFCTKTGVIARIHDLFYYNENNKLWPKRKIIKTGFGPLVYQGEDRSLQPEE